MSEVSVLYVEDDLETRENYTYLLELFFDKIYSSSNALDAQEIYNNHHIDLAIIDINLSEKIDGLELARNIRKKDEIISLIMFTAYSDRERLLQAVSLKLEAYLIKPITNDKFINLIKTFIEKKKSKKNKLKKIILQKNIYWDVNKNDIFINKKALNLTKKELLLVDYLIKRIGTFVEKDELIINIWHDEISDYSHNQKLTQLVYRLNKKIIDLRKVDLQIVKNNYSIGYKIEEYKV